MLAKGMIEWKGDIMMDSFDSGDSTKSNNGIYDYRFATDKAPIASLYSNVMLNGGIVYGEGETGATGYITNGTLGSKEWVTNHPGEIDPSAIRNDLNRDLRDTKLPSGAESWPTLTYCGCTQSVTNPLVETTQITSLTFPSPVPPGGVTTNRTGYVTGETNYPTWGGAYVVRTNISTDTWATMPSTIPTNYTVISTNGATWRTNLYSQGVPSTYLSPPGLILLTNWTTDAAYPASGTYVGTVVTNSGQNKNFPDTYSFAKKIGWAYQIASSYTVQFPTYDVETRTFTYTGSQTNYQVTTSTYVYVATAGKYQMGNLNLSGQDQMLIKAPGTTTLYITGDFNMSGQSQIFVERGASLVIYLAGDADLKGNGIANDNNMAANLQIWGLPTCTEIDLGGNAAFTGTVYAPQADIEAGGGGNDGYDVVGSIVGKTIKFNGHFKMHYDTSLGRNGPSEGFFADRWQEEVVGTTR
jgi:choice-of-anchor A domain-containing protein